GIPPAVRPLHHPALEPGPRGLLHHVAVRPLRRLPDANRPPRRLDLRATPSGGARITPDFAEPPGGAGKQLISRNLLFGRAPQQQISRNLSVVGVAESVGIGVGHRDAVSAARSP